MTAEFAATMVPSWTPPVAISEAIGDRIAIDRFVARISTGFTAPKVEFGQPEALTVMGRHFAVISEKAGLLPSSIHTVGRFAWHQAFSLVRNIRIPEGLAQPPLIAASSGYDNYYHWTAETLGSLLMHRLLHPASKARAVIPVITASWQRETLALLNPLPDLIEVGREDAAVFDSAIITNLTARDFGLCPHPSVLRRFRTELCSAESRSSRSGRVYVARLDAGGRRPLTNENELCAMLGNYGFDIVVPSRMSVKDQISAFAHADLIVAPHGAALANLFYVNEGHAGPIVIELQQQGYLSPVYAKLSQAKSLDYCAIVNPSDGSLGHHHEMGWHADIKLVETVVSRKLRQIAANT